MSKKKQRNGFFYFMLDMQQELKYQGRNVAMKDMPLFAGPSWSKLSDAQKQRYNMRAKQEKSNGVQTTSSVASSEKQTPGRRDCLGNLISDRQNPEAGLLQKQVKECEDLRSMFPTGNRVTLESFWFIDFQSLCHIAHKPEHKYFPCEIGIVQYSLNDGIINEYHKFIKPGPIPIGYRYLAQSTSEATHQIPVEGVPQAVRDYRMLLGEVEKFLSCDGEEELPPVFAKRDSVGCVKWSLQWLADNAGVTNRITRVYEVENLISELVSHIDKREISPFTVEELLKTSSYDHDSDTRCSYHQELERIHCSLGIAHTYCHVMSELLCPIYSISLTRKHLSIIPSASIVSSKIVPSNPPRRSGQSYVATSPDGSLCDDEYYGGQRIPREYTGMGRGIGRGMGRGVGVASYDLYQPLGRGQHGFP